MTVVWAVEWQRTLKLNDEKRAFAVAFAELAEEALSHGLCPGNRFHRL